MWGLFRKKPKADNSLPGAAVTQRTPRSRREEMETLSLSAFPLRSLRLCGKLIVVVVVLACLALLPIHGQAPSLLLTPDAPEMNRRAPDRFNARLETSKGVILIEIHRDWAPNGVDRFYNLVRAR